MRPALRTDDELPELESSSRGRVLDVSLAGARGERWRAIGIGGTFNEALAWARASAPAGTAWLVSDWSDLYGDQSSPSPTGVTLTSDSPSAVTVSRWPLQLGLALDAADELGVAVAQLEAHRTEGSAYLGPSSPSTTILYVPGQPGESLSTA